MYMSIENMPLELPRRGHAHRVPEVRAHSVCQESRNIHDRSHINGEYLYSEMQFTPAMCSESPPGWRGANRYHRHQRQRILVHTCRRRRMS